jgi:predicted PP-loop superfamily ATPase
MRSAVAQQRPVDDDKIAGALSVPELQTAVEELTSVLRRLGTAPEYIAEGTELVADAAVPAGRNAPAPRLARELRKLMQDIETTR